MINTKAVEQPNLKTERLVLRPFRQDDADSVRSLANNFNVAKMTLNIPHPYEVGMAEEWIATHQANWVNRRRVTYAIIDSEFQTLIGTVGLIDIEETRAELGYWIGEPFWGNGYCAEAARELIAFAFQNLSIQTITAEHLTRNSASGKVMQKVGMKYVSSINKRDRDNEMSTVKVYKINNKHCCSA